ncbi:hypothetical protein Leryth_018644 [Lithospermum erythrorhizon]|nr:hypothetical protein Leryth_018644 [Lithospermum erythrorhizon]
MIAKLDKRYSALVKGKLLSLSKGADKSKDNTTSISDPKKFASMEYRTRTLSWGGDYWVRGSLLLTDTDQQLYYVVCGNWTTRTEAVKRGFEDKSFYCLALTLEQIESVAPISSTSIFDDSTLYTCTSKQPNLNKSSKTNETELPISRLACRIVNFNKFRWMFKKTTHVE